LLTRNEERKFQNPHSWKAKSATTRGERNSRSLAPLGMTSARVGTKDKRGARQTHERPSCLLPKSSCTSVDHLLTRQERRSPNVRNISRGVNAFCGRGRKLCTRPPLPFVPQGKRSGLRARKAGRTRWRVELAATRTKIAERAGQARHLRTTERLRDDRNRFKDFCA
jgi:hypothetical protein